MISNKRLSVSSTELDHRVALVALDVGQLTYFHFDTSSQVAFAGFDLEVHTQSEAGWAFATSIGQRAILEDYWLTYFGTYSRQFSICLDLDYSCYKYSPAISACLHDF